jgi:hypothetical protein
MGQNWTGFVELGSPQPSVFVLVFQKQSVKTPHRIMALALPQDRVQD